MAFQSLFPCCSSEFVHIKRFEIQRVTRSQNNAASQSAQLLHLRAEMTSHFKGKGNLYILESEKLYMYLSVEWSNTILYLSQCVQDDYIY